MDNELAIFLSEYATSQIHWINIESASDVILANQGNDQVILENINAMTNSINGYVRSSEIISGLAETYKTTNEKMSVAIGILANDVKLKTERLGELSDVIDEAMDVMTAEGNIFMDDESGEVPEEADATDEDPEEEEENVFIEDKEGLSVPVDMPLPTGDSEDDTEDIDEELPEEDNASDDIDTLPDDVPEVDIDAPEEPKFVKAFYDKVGRFRKHPNRSKDIPLPEEIEKEDE